jgi:Domain of unknown function (DUF1707)/Cell wall-active antibiotics response 4TMS YvqF
MSDLSPRVSDEDREQAVTSLRDDLVAGRLTLDEFAQRVELAYQARVGDDLARIREDLPAPPLRAPKRRRLSAVVFGHVIRRGRMQLPVRSVGLSAFGDLDLDLREARVDGSDVSLRFVVLFGNADIYVPEGIDVEVSGGILFGRRRDWGRESERADAPTVHVRVIGCVGTIDVWRVPHDMRGDYGEIIEQLRRQQRELPA